MVCISLFQVNGNVLKIVRLLLLLCFIVCPGSAFSQDNRDMKHDALPEEILNAPEDLFKITLDTLSIKERIYVRTNFLEWALLSPNAMVEFDILPYNWNKWTIAVGGRYNDFAKQVMSPKNVFNIKTFRIETRRYWHTTYRDADHPRVHRGHEYNNKVGLDGSVDNKKKEKEWNFIRKALSRQRANPREERRAYYAGAFISMSDFSIKLGQQGKQGKATMFGGTFGFHQPLYGYTSGNTVDLEFGVSAGVAKVEYDTYQYNSKFDCYPKIGKTKNEIVPALSEVRLALVYRFGRSSRERYHERYGRDYVYTEKYDSIWEQRDFIKKRRKEYEEDLRKLDSVYHNLDSLAKQSPILSAYEDYNKMRDTVDIDSTEFGRMLREAYAEHFMLKEAQKVSPERYQQVKDSLDAIKSAKKPQDFDSGAKKRKENYLSEKERIKEKLKEEIEKRKANIRAIKSNKPIDEDTEASTSATLPSGSAPSADHSSKGKKKKSKKDKKREETEAAGTKQDSVPVASPADTPTESEATTPEEKGGESE